MPLDYLGRSAGLREPPENKKHETHPEILSEVWFACRIQPMTTQTQLDQVLMGEELSNPPKHVVSEVSELWQWKVLRFSVPDRHGF
jgi:hypothetical protein